MTAFFIPQLTPGHADDEDAYAAICARAEEDTGRAPRERRIFSLWSRRSGTDCITEVGKPDPIHGDMVLAILDLGRNQSYMIHCGRPGDEAGATCEVVGRHVYSVTEFSP
jgi:hypothetical protein